MGSEPYIQKLSQWDMLLRLPIVLGPKERCKALRRQGLPDLHPAVWGDEAMAIGGIAPQPGYPSILGELAATRMCCD